MLHIATDPLRGQHLNSYPPAPSTLQRLAAGTGLAPDFQPVQHAVTTIHALYAWDGTPLATCTLPLVVFYLPTY